MRRALALISVIWLASQLAVVTVSPVIAVTIAMDEHGTRCTCRHGVDASCPMHHEPVGGSKVCVMQSAGDQASVLVPTFLNVGGPIPDPPSLVEPRSTSGASISPFVQAIARSVAPDPPPPRS